MYQVIKHLLTSLLDTPFWMTEMPVRVQRKTTMSVSLLEQGPEHKQAPK